MKLLNYLLINKFQRMKIVLFLKNNDFLILFSYFNGLLLYIIIRGNILNY